LLAFGEWLLQSPPLHAIDLVESDSAIGKDDGDLQRAQIRQRIVESQKSGGLWQCTTTDANRTMSQNQKDAALRC
jgi:hypothetical protein